MPAAADHVGFLRARCWLPVPPRVPEEKCHPPGQRAHTRLQLEKGHCKSRKCGFSHELYVSRLVSLAPSVQPTARRAVQGQEAASSPGGRPAGRHPARALRVVGPVTGRPSQRPRGFVPVREGDGALLPVTRLRAAPSVLPARNGARRCAVQDAGGGRRRQRDPVPRPSSIMLS